MKVLHALPLAASEQRTCSAALPWVLASALALIQAVSAAAATAAPDPVPAKESDPFPITLRVTPSIVMTGSKTALTLAGETLPAGQKPVTVTLRSDKGVDAGTQRAAPDAKGAYRLTPAPPAQAGLYTVTAVAPDGRGRANATFRAVDANGVGAEAESALKEAVAGAEEGVAAAEAQVEAQPNSPAKDKARKKIADAKQALGTLRAHNGGAPIRGLIGAIASNAALQESLRPRLEGLTAAVADTSRETERVRTLTATMSHADVGCHQLAFVTEVFKAISALLNVKKKLLDTGIGLAKDILSDAAVNSGKRQGDSAATAFLKGQAVKKLPEMGEASKLAGNAASILTDLGALVSDTLFGAYCEQFTGPLEAIMNARLYFASPKTGGSPRLYWTYNYKLSGRVVLYYPKSAMGNASIRLNGRIEGYAHGFDTQEDALTVMFPGLMAGAIQRKVNFPPIEAGGMASSIASQGSVPMSAYVEGSAAGLALPNSFLIPVEGVLEKDSITMLLGPAKVDIDAVHRVAVLIVAPMVGGLGPQVTWYPLSFQKVRPFLVNAADGESLKLKLSTVGDKMLAEGVFAGKVDKPKAKADYTLKIKACNPGC
ncbi:MAG TPA: hypothetical protein VLA61_03300 [Ideonella sp.]|uniref:hypothetical protein n=1 Tax=Ideonella sp. TaxID=1929293 RepID=UPI002BF73BFA|nr:hypothetical protein [Ideonella sp.]HSI47272.1 hypothetical protein [Ideonella sp.]